MNPWNEHLLLRLNKILIFLREKDLVSPTTSIVSLAITNLHEGCIEEVVPLMFKVEAIVEHILGFTNVVTKGRIHQQRRL